MTNLPALFDMVKDKLQHWLEIIVLSLPNAAIAAVILAASWVVTGLLRKLIARGLRRFIHNEGLANLLATLLRGVLLAGGVIIALNVLALDRAVLSLLTGVGVIGLALGFAFQDMASNLISGVALVLRPTKPFKVGDLIETNKLRAFVTQINLRDTELRTFEGQAVFIPNSSIFKNQLTNFTLLGTRRVIINLGVSYGDDLAKIEQVLKGVLETLDTLHPEKKSDVNFTEFGDSSITAMVRFWVEYPKTDVVVAKHKAIMAIKKAFDENDLLIPFPIRTMDFGIRGGEPLTKMLGDGHDAEPGGGNGGNGAQGRAPTSHHAD